MHAYSCRPGFLNLGTIDILGQVILCPGGCPMLCKMLSIPGSSLLDCTGSFRCNNKKSLQILPNVSWGKLPLPSFCNLFWCIARISLILVLAAPGSLIYTSIQMINLQKMSFWPLMVPRETGAPLWAYAYINGTPNYTGRYYLMGSFPHSLLEWDWIGEIHVGYFLRWTQSS